jgi:hypothetical protein
MRHKQEMEQYETEFEETKQEALEKISVSSGGGTAVGIRLAAIIVLVVAIITAFIQLDPYYAAERRAARDVKKHYAEYRQKVPRYHQKYDTIHTEIPFPRKDCSRPAGRAAGKYPHKLRHALHQHPPLPLSIIHYIKSKNTW